MLDGRWLIAAALFILAALHIVQAVGWALARAYT